MLWDFSCVADAFWTNAHLFSVWRTEAFCCVQLLPEGASLLQKLAHPGGRPVKHNKTNKSKRTIHDLQLQHDLQQLWAPPSRPVCKLQGGLHLFGNSRCHRIIRAVHLCIVLNFDENRSLLAERLRHGNARPQWVSSNS